MKNIFIIALFLLISLSLKAQNIPISDSLIHKISVLKFEEYAENVEEHEQITQQLSKEIVGYTNQKKDSVFGALVVLYDNFDADKDNELIIFMGYVWESEILTFDKINNQWFLIYREDITLGNSLDLDYGINIIQDTPLIRVKHRHGSGTGMYVDEYLFYRFTQSGFKKVLTLGGKHWVSSGSILYLNFDLHTQFYTHSSGEIDAIIESKFYLPYKSETRELSSIILFEKTVKISFEWNKEKEEYQPVFSKENNLSEQQQEFLLLQKENQKLFYQLFKLEIEKVRKTLSGKKLDVLNEWIEHMEKQTK
ncbi:hypothetical protein [Bernardetia sp.]|uniref:hypothetical protein n=1 Tax=Bernardetia sp. TaxID=1937974 RepID=UPI0025BC28BA|nr:hypothetical protein [Bernardetia sp.]